MNIIYYFSGDRLIKKKNIINKVSEKQMIYFKNILRFKPEVTDEILIM